VIKKIKSRGLAGEMHCMCVLQQQQQQLKKKLFIVRFFGRSLRLGCWLRRTRLRRSCGSDYNIIILHSIIYYYCSTTRVYNNNNNIIIIADKIIFAHTRLSVWGEWGRCLLMVIAGAGERGGGGRGRRGRTGSNTTVINNCRARAECR